MKTDYLLRHAKKGTDGLLSPEGEQKALDFGRTLKEDRTKVSRIITSPFPRNIRTSELISEGYGGSDIIEDDRLAYHFSDSELKLYAENPHKEILRCLISCPGSFLEDAIRTFEATEEYSGKDGNYLEISHNSNVSGLAYMLWLEGDKLVHNMPGRDTEPLEGIKSLDITSDGGSKYCSFCGLDDMVGSFNIYSNLILRINEKHLVCGKDDCTEMAAAYAVMLFHKIRKRHVGLNKIGDFNLLWLERYCRSPLDIGLPMKIREKRFEKEEKKYYHNH